MKTILVIEDDKDILENISELIELNGFKTICAENGVKGIELTETNKIDLILCDIKMGNLNGYEVLNQLSAEGKLKDIPFVFMTALSEPSEKKFGLEIGADEYLIKPFTEPDLLQSINKAFRKRMTRKFKEDISSFLIPCTFYPIVPKLSYL